MGEKKKEIHWSSKSHAVLENVEPKGGERKWRVFYKRNTAECGRQRVWVALVSVSNNK